MPRNPEDHGNTDANTDAKAAQLAAQGQKGELNRNFSPLAMLGLAFAILNTWTALAASLSLALPSGGPTSVLWGLITAGVCNLCLAVSLAEFLSAYPTAGGQYHWVAVISWKSWIPLLSWITGWINVSGWIALTCSGGLLCSQLIIGVIALTHPSFVAQRWHQFLIYIGYNMLASLVNAFLTGALPIITRAAFIWSLTGFVVISITVLACASPNYTSADYVFTQFINETGWPGCIAWMMGLLQGGLGLIGFDAVAHMIEEIPNPAVEGPRIMIACVGIGVFTGFILLMVLLFVAGQIDGPDGVIMSRAGPLLQIFYNATGNKAGSICLLMDRGLPFSRVFAEVHPKLGLPLNALFLNVTLVMIFGCIFLGSSSAFNALISVSVVALGVSYGIPVAINCLRGRRMLPGSRSFKLSAAVGWTANLIGIIYVVLTTVLFVFPPQLPVTGSNMNYCVVVFFIIIVISIVQWFVDGKKNFTGPRFDLEDLQSGEVVVMDPCFLSKQGSGAQEKETPGVRVLGIHNSEPSIRL
ncbi:amino acid transporter [Marssonina coronariae]|uniref:Amino acid transporter n=1 Tax=Diplocarpon coronariae TaxID=2795749 RepID=A0A218Z512_9HELO|nr:amino acid transporter [Marssonina coronariae]